MSLISCTQEMNRLRLFNSSVCLPVAVDMVTPNPGFVPMGLYHRYDKTYQELKGKIITPEQWWEITMPIFKSVGVTDRREVEIIKPRSDSTKFWKLVYSFNNQDRRTILEIRHNGANRGHAIGVALDYDQGNGLVRMGMKPTYFNLSWSDLYYQHVANDQGDLIVLPEYRPNCKLMN